MSPSASSRSTDLLPGWARAADAAAVALITLGACIALFGGARLRISGVLMSATSVWRPLAAAVALLVVRHALERRPSLPARLLSGVRALGASRAFAVVWPAVVWSRLSVLLVGYLAVATIGFPVNPPFRVSRHEWLNLPARWDTGWYLDIAKDGYEFDAATYRREHQNIAFFPAYPAMMRVVGGLAGAGRRTETRNVPDMDEYLMREERILVTAGLFVSLAAFCWALVYVYRLARDELSDEQAATAVALLAAYPFAVFYSAAYTESLYLLGASGCFYHLRRCEWRRAGAWGLLVGLTRPNGCFLSAPLVVLAWEHARNRREDARGISAHVPAWLTAAMPGVGMLMFSGFMYRLTGRPFVWAEAHGAWGRTYRGVDDLVVDQYKMIADEGLFKYVADLPYESFNALGLLCAFGLLVPIIRRSGLAYGLLILVNLVPALFMGGFMSTGRLTATLFPIFVALARLVPSRHVPTWITGFAALQGLAAALFFTWRPFI